MNATATLPANSTPQAFNLTERLTRDRRFWRGGILISGSLGVVCVFVGVLFSFEAFFGLTERSLSGTGTVLIAASFPLLFLAAHCMDKARNADEAIRREYCRKHGLKDEEC